MTDLPQRRGLDSPPTGDAKATVFRPMTALRQLQIYCLEQKLDEPRVSKFARDKNARIHSVRIVVGDLAEHRPVYEDVDHTIEACASYLLELLRQIDAQT